ncbi:MAG: rod shape-determining protein RodA [Rickettsiales bacterium]|jgi:rod shape determining protein RodA|nr:rod shape-determining protein RodA [Rickettsiales bacterium]
MTTQTRFSRADNISFTQKLSGFSWPLFALMCMVLILSVISLYSAGRPICDNTGVCNGFGGWRPYALSQLGKIGLGFVAFFIAAFANIKTWLKNSYLIYGTAVILIIMVSFIGHTGMGAQRWLDIGVFHIQPSEFIKIALVIALARYFAWQNSVDLSKFRNYLIPILMLLVPFIFIVIQPDLGTALSLMFITIGFFWIVGAHKKWFLIAGVIGLLCAPMIWYGGLHDYQRQRIITFINPDSDPSGAGYQINQSKIAFGSGGIIGKGYLGGTQSHLSFLPEKQTDFIFAMFGEELGFVGSFILLLIYSAIIAVLFWIAKTSRNRFGQLLCFGFMLNFFVYYFINISMVLGLMPTVGVPLPLMSFGGSSLLSLMFGFGLAQSAHINKNQQLSAKGT